MNTSAANENQAVDATDLRQSHDLSLEGGAGRTNLNEEQGVRNVAAAPVLKDGPSVSVAHFTRKIADGGVGFCFYSLEVFNWGTFDGKPRKMQLDGKNTLLTGNIGSGKSTLVDAITTLLIPANKISYNKAAGAENKERGLRSYVMGSYNSELNEATGSSRPVSLRKSNTTYSVIIGIFKNAQLGRTVSLAQVFWLKDGQAQPERFFVCAPQELSIKEHFSGFGADINSLRKRLRAQGIVLYDAFPGYAAAFRRLLGINSEQAMDLFLRAVSMKSVGNLTEFTRSNMLEPSKTNEKFDELVKNFDDLNTSHERILKDKRQIDLLTPINEDCMALDLLCQRAIDLRAQREALSPFMNKSRVELLGKRINALQQVREAKSGLIKSHEEKRANLREDEATIKSSMSSNGGDRLERLGSQIEKKTVEINARREKNNRYKVLASQAGITPALTEASFVMQRAQLAADLIEVTSQEQILRNAQDEITAELAKSRSKRQDVVGEMSHLQGRASNIPAKQVGIRRQMCAALGLSEDCLPFAGELMQVKESEKTWEGAIERVLRGFGLSLLVPDQNYHAVQQWVDKTNLGGKLVYHHVNAGSVPSHLSLHPNSLVRKLSVRGDGVMLDWMEAQLSSRYDLACCSSDAQFRREKKALTINGQLKSSDRHEKDDSYNLNNRATYVLGFSSAEKIAALDVQRIECEAQFQGLAEKKSAMDKAASKMAVRRTAMSKLEEHTIFQDMDWETLELDIAALSKEKTELEGSSNILAQLQLQLAEISLKILKQDQLVNDLRDDRAKLDQRLFDDNAHLAQAQACLAELDLAALASRFDEVQLRLNTFLAGKSFTYEAITKIEKDVRDALQVQIDTEDAKQKSSRDKIVHAMSSFKSAFPNETSDFDASIDAATEYKQMLVRLKGDDLPAHEASFKAMLNKDVIQGTAVVAGRLNSEGGLITEKISHINSLLKDIEYDTGTYIQIVSTPTRDVEVLDFRADLRECTERSVSGSGDEQYAETKFFQIKKIVDRLRGREGYADQDKAWRAKVTDVRNWFVFAASERYSDNDEQREYYSDSGGKSGGQKEKLAYTVLAASLAYQFGAKRDEKEVAGFRFVVIDEAFGRGSDESTSYGLKLFKQLGLQLLIVTPLQKIDVIEKFVSSVCMVEKADGNCSQLTNLSIAEYLAKKASR
jgi:uncharacterized protein YPO0396